MPFSRGMGLDFYIFLTTHKKSQKYNIYILDEAACSQIAMQTESRHFTEPPSAGRPIKPSRQWSFLKRFLQTKP